MVMVMVKVRVRVSLQRGRLRDLLEREHHGLHRCLVGVRVRTMGSIVAWLGLGLGVIKVRVSTTGSIAGLARVRVG